MKTVGTLEITFQSDWHIGSGAGIPGSLDRQVLRDVEGFPYVPGKTITGIVRDSAEMVAAVLDHHEGNDRWQNTLKSLFGGQPDSHLPKGQKSNSAYSAIVGFGDAVLSSKLRKKINKSSRGVKEALFFAQPGVKISRNSGRSLEDHLFTVEQVRAGCVLRAPVKFSRNLTRNLTQDEEQLLSKAFEGVRRMGGKRRRGGGKCVLKFCLNNIPEQEEGANRGWEILSKLSPGENFGVSLSLRLMTLQGVIINRVTQGNVARSLPYIPGTSLLPMFSNFLKDFLGERRIRTAIFEGDIRVSPLYPETLGSPSYPMPLVFGSPKMDSEKIINHLIEPAPKDPEDSKKEQQMKERRGGWFALDKSQHFILLGSDEGDQAVPVLRTHNTVEDAMQRPTSDVGGVFTYEALPKDKVFRGTLEIEAFLWKEMQKKIPPKKLASFLNQEFSIGQSRKDEYGRVALSLEGVTAWRSREIPLRENYLVVYLASDVILRGKTLGYSGNPEDLREALARELEVKLDWVSWEEEKSPLGGDRGDAGRAGRSESWHSRWMLPRPSILFLQRGSVYLFKVTGDWQQEKAAYLEWAGIGDRRAEGYGKILLNPEFLLGWSVRKKEKEQQKDTPSSGTGVSDLENPEDSNFFVFLQKIAAREKIRRYARMVVYEESTKDHPFGIADKLPEASQIGALREAAATIVESNGGEDLFLNWLAFGVPENNGGWRKSRLDAWGKWHSWVHDFVDRGNVNFIWNKLNIPEEKPPLEDFLDRKDPFLWRYAVAVFFDYFCEAFFDQNKQSYGGVIQ
nr:RAMP superfamily CRISPR-associated protein [uncultured Dethiosulfovibrio sp.]